MSIFDEIKTFSSKLEKALEIDINDYIDDGPDDIQWHTPNYIIYLVSRCQREWLDLLEVCPYPIGHQREKFIDTWCLDHIFSHSNEYWHYRFRGTSTENLPDLLLRASIIQDIKNAYGKDIMVIRPGDQIVTKETIIPEPIKIESRFEILDL